MDATTRHHDDTLTRWIDGWTRLAVALAIGACAGFALSATSDRAPTLPWLMASTGLAAFIAIPATRPRRDAGERNPALRSWVPGAIAHQIEHGLEPDAGERDVTVLFVDLRGYTSYAESHAPRAVFEMLNAYSDRVSRVVGRHGGWLVDFHGDGLMAIFGAPEMLARKEQAALDAARELVLEIERMDETSALRHGLHPLVGVGIATGTAYVGSIKTADRFFWSATGDPTNLAARLQDLTRELPTPIAVDGRTFERAGGCEGAAAYRAVPIRGRTQRVDVWAVPVDRGLECPLPAIQMPLAPATARVG